MDSHVKGLISFTIGGLVGAGVAIIFLRNKYERMYQEGVESMKRVYADLIAKEQGYKTETEGGEEQAELAKLNLEKPDLNELAKNVAKDHQFIDYSKKTEIKTVEEVKNEHEPEEKEPEDHYVIDPNDFGEFEDYGRIFLTYYADGILADENDDILDDSDIDNSVGLDFEDHFGEYEEDSVHIRNDRLKCDYEILADIRTFEKAIDDKRLKSD